MSPATARSALLAAGLLAPPAVSGLLSLARDQVSAVNAVLVMVVLVVAVAAGGSRVAGVVAALSAAAWFDFFWLPPFRTFTIAQRDDVETAVLLMLVGLALTEIVLWGRRRQADASRREGYLSGVVRAATTVARGEATSGATLTSVSQQIADVLGVERCRYVEGPPRAGAQLDQDGEVRRAGRVLDVRRAGLPVDDVTVIPVVRAGEVVGRFELTSASHAVWPTLEQRLVAVTLADLAAPVTPPAPSRRAASGPGGG
ncbi:DUF4118 domain-containing protein [Nocardioides flavescens]|uniref:DUF4118 domain-containing protein n=1 Tax=Nocardioides flavescens TaxID=2691959 RepID=A0A6L7EXG3_9ACTN|nr:DUF4118 domain-containing protein [Nocardioides flavescens]MXG90556.1 DUF4118 domain-containing protein [Nocardioides flavescens]